MGFISVLIIIVAVLLIIVVLIQNSKGGGIASNFASSTQVVGVKRSAEIIEKITWFLASALIVLSLATAAVGSGSSAPENPDAVIKNATAPAPNTTGATGAPTPTPTSQPTKP
ncbi:MAG TPA: preprotein translocase subunit SecG [Bacteroidia bacterium]